MDVQAASLDGAICAGHGIDVSAEGVLATVVLTSLIGLIIWLIFAVLRPKLPQLYAVREWFLNPEPPYVSLRPRHLSSGLLAFLHPPVPIVPALPEDTSAYGNSPVDDAHLFPSDEQLSQRLLWVALLIALGWTLLGLIGALPLYLVSTPCLANSSPSLTYGSAYSTLTDLSLVRLLRMYDNYNVSTSDNQSNVMRRAVIDGHDRTDNARARLIVLTVLTILLGVLPVLWKLWKEFRLVANYRARWLEVRCGGIEMVLNELEVAEAEYIAAFQLASVANEEAELERTESQNRRRSLSLGKPRTLGSTHSRSGSPGSPAPTSYLAPKSYYKLKGMSNVTEDGFSNRSSGLPASEFGTITAPDIRGSRFQQDPNRESIRFMPAEGGYPPMPFGGNHAGPNREDSAMATDQFGQPIGHRGPPPEGDQKQAFPVTDSPAHEIAPQGPPVVERNLASPVDGASSIRPISGQDERLPLVYMSIRQARSRLKALNAEVNDLQQEGFNSIAEGTRIKGWLLFGRGIRHVPGIQMIEGRSKEDIRWDELQDGSGMMRGIAWWLLIAVVGVALGAAFIPVVGLAMAGAPNFAQYLSFLRSISDGDSHNFGAALATTLAPAIVATLFISIAAWVIHYSSKFSGKPSVSTTRLAEFKAVFAILVIVCTIWLVTLGGLLFATDAISRAQHRGASVAEGTIYIAILLMLIIVNVAIISPGLLMLQPVRLWRVLKAQRKSITPRQRFRGASDLSLLGLLRVGIEFFVV
ncbi:hypothetical protein FRB99_007589 [Tulasnella sp. 403]|nr:hypothetical protein FRB99_007589 [Tulasnella sp. 403]